MFYCLFIEAPRAVFKIEEQNQKEHWKILKGEVAKMLEISGTRYSKVIFPNLVLQICYTTNLLSSPAFLIAFIKLKLSS